jgi:hypothetical protein
MKNLLTTTSMIEIEVLKQILDENNIPCSIRNECPSTSTPEESPAEIWILNDDDYARADKWATILRERRESLERLLAQREAEKREAAARAEYICSSWYIKLSSGWSAKEEGDVVNVSSEGGVGVLEIRAFEHFVTDDDLYFFAQYELADGKVPRDVSYGDFRGIEFSYVEEERYWRSLWLRNGSDYGSLKLMVNYDCAAEDQATDFESVNQMLESLESKITDDA